jgi:hypothetical protein
MKLHLYKTEMIEEIVLEKINKKIKKINFNKISFINKSKINRIIYNLNK